MEAWAKPVGNLSPRAASQRVRNGVIMLTIALVVAVLLVKTEVHVAWRALLGLPFFLAANGFYQGLYKT